MDHGLDAPPLPDLPFVPPGPDVPGDVREVARLVAFGEETRAVLAAVVGCASRLPGVRGAGLVLPTDAPTPIAGSLAAEAGEPRDWAREYSSAARSPEVASFDVVCLGVPLGALLVDAAGPLGPGTVRVLEDLAYHSGVVYERHKLSGTVQHLLDRLQVLNELNQLIASNVGLGRVLKNVARESAYRFGADVALTFILSEDGSCLEAKGGYGCPPDAVPKFVDSAGGILGQVMRTGGHLSVPNLAGQADHRLSFMETLGMTAIDACCLEVREEPLGAILIGYRRENYISQDDLSRFEEFCRASGVAIANARTQERITAYSERLEELVATRTADLEVQTARAEEANQAKSQFLANMSHELRTPLTAIVGYSSVLADGIFGPVNERQADALGAITRSSDHLKNLIDDVLNLARIESGKEEPEPVKVPVSELLGQAYKLMMQTAVGKGVRLQSARIASETLAGAVFADHKHVHQILINLISNAVKYTPKGGTVWVEAETVVDKVKISVRDTGVGLSAEKQARLFERFERGEDTYSKAQEGTGIGLNLTKRLVELNGGRIGVESREGEGSTFWVMMPAASDGPEAGARAGVAAGDASSPGVRLDGLSVVLVDDNRDTLDVLKLVFSAAGAQVRGCQCVRDALTEISASAPDVILTDLAMPGESGLVLIEAVRSHAGPVSNVPVIVLSACAFESDRIAAAAAGASLFVPKPFRPGELVRTVRNVTLKSAMDGVRE